MDQVYLDIERIANLGNNWDGYGTNAPSEETANRMRRIVGQIPVKEDLIYRVGPWGEGFELTARWGIYEAVISIEDEKSPISIFAMTEDRGPSIYVEREEEHSSVHEFKKLLDWVVDRRKWYLEQVKGVEEEFKRWGCGVIIQIEPRYSHRTTTFYVSGEDFGIAAQNVRAVWGNKISDAYDRDTSAFYESLTIVDVCAMMEVMTGGDS